MSNQVERGTRQREPGREGGLGALHQHSEFRGPVEPQDTHDHSNDHFALIYERREDQFASAIPFICEGLERGEQCLYVADDNSREEVVEAMRDHGIDVNAALESGALSVLTPADTYRRTGEFDRTTMLEFWEESLEQAKDEDGYTGLRAAAEMTWALEGDTGPDELVEYEAVLNSLYQDEDYAVMCQYNRERFPASVIHDVIKTHPHIVSDSTVSQNFYYTPPEKFFGSEKMEAKVDRMMQTLQERTEVKTALTERQEYLERVFESSHDGILIVDPEADEIVDANRAATEMLGYTHDELVALAPSDVHPNELDAFREFVEGVFEDGTGWTDELTCHTNDRGQIPAEISASRMEHNGRPVLLAVVRDNSERRKWERAQRQLYEITSDPDRPFEEKLQDLLDLGCERFDMELGGIAVAEPDTDHFEVEVTNGEHEYLVPGESYPLSETYCRVPADEGGTCAITAPVSDEFEGKLCHDKFGVRTYLGTYLEFEDDSNRTFWFVSTEPRAEAFSEAERTFQHLMGQWVKYELERRQREQELREHTEYLSALIETAPECIKTVAADGTLLQMNPAGLDMVEADSESAVIGESVYGLIAPEHRETFREFNERICQDERGVLEFDIIGLDGTRRHMETHAAPLHRPDGTTSQLALTRDITEQIERERELERTLDLLEKTERIADVGGWEINPETKDVFWTDHIFELLEVDADEEPPLEDALDMYHEDDQGIVEDAVENALVSGDPFDVEVRIRTNSGDIRWLRLQGIPEIVDNEAASFRGAAQDITERKQREQRLEEVIERLEASNERLEQFAYAASHDLQEPLRMVSTYLQLLERRYENALDEDGEEFLEFAVDGANRMREMIDGLLAYSRVETQGDPLERIDLDAVFDDVLADLRIQISESDAEITAEDLPRVRGDATQLRQVFQNLLENAITYSGDEKPRIHASAERDGAEWVVSVRDEGIGIDTDNQDCIFEVFQRLHTHGEYDGTGIGLALCERIVERHGGDIWVESAPDEGSTFSFTLPVAAGERREATGK
ncbi:MEDS domain-containing protein [Natronosalvus rutilus]|uniref:histidine kinase n=1 Tax=Natronosalvus rutilus TaxID=2953753 RepID=A0A9E7NCA5_9EURY|nr:MEDS domain-containing protein [Natronosalvus rutilus]UTF54258.1 MEDS domain-containing protein [Natronosalvus rutilus]